MRPYSLVLLAALGACHDAPIVNLPATRSDSAGIQIVTSPTPAWKPGEEWHLSDAPTITIGGAGDTAQHAAFDGIAAALRLDNGRILVADGGSQEIRFFDAYGHFVKAVGRRGDGPGEFQGFAMVKRMRGDTILVGSGDGRATRISEVGALLGTTKPERGWDFADAFDDGVALARGLPAHMGAGGTVDLLGQRFGGGELRVADESQPIKNDSLAVRLVRDDGTDGGPFGSFPNVVWTNPGFHRLTFGPQGYGTAVGDKYYRAYSDQFQIAIYDEKGTLSRIVRRAWTPVAVTKAEADSFRAAVLQNTDQDTRPRLEKWINHEFVVAEQHPAFADLIVDRTHNIWVREWRRLDDGFPMRDPLQFGPLPHWTVFDSTGQWLGSIATPASLSIKEIGADYVLAVARDADQVEQVRVYKLIEK